MKIVVLGAGVVGVTTAYYLAKDGHDVTVIERHAGPAMETSFANAGEISPGYASPWAAPGVPLKAIRWLLMRHAPLIVKPALDPEMLIWTGAMLSNCTKARYAINKARMLRLASYSRSLLEEVRNETGIQYDQRMQGTLQLFRSDRQMAAARKDIDVLQQSGIMFEVLDRQGCVSAEPGLAHTTATIAGGLRLPGDETGDCRLFTGALANLAAQRGVQFRFDEVVRDIVTDRGRATGIATDKGTICADHVVVTLGTWSPQLMRSLGVRLPVYPVKGYSMTVPILDPARAPVSTLLDETLKIAITRLGDRIRIGGMAELAGFDRTLPEKRTGTLKYCLNLLFPGAGDEASATFWAGLRPMTPDGTPIIGACRVPNVHLNTGHGTLGWTMACGSAKVISDQIIGRVPDIRTDDLALDRAA